MGKLSVLSTLSQPSESASKAERPVSAHSTCTHCKDLPVHIAQSSAHSPCTQEPEGPQQWCEDDTEGLADAGAHQDAGNHKAHWDGHWQGQQQEGGKDGLCVWGGARGQGGEGEGRATRADKLETAVSDSW
jgi:hypothetical protein